MLNILFITYNTMLHKACTFDGNVFLLHNFSPFQWKRNNNRQTKILLRFLLSKSSRMTWSFKHKSKTSQLQTFLYVKYNIDTL